MRVLVTGSRDWPFPELIWRDLDRLLAEYGEPIVVVHGGAVGADTYARAWVREAAKAGRDVRHELHAAHWSRHGKKAGPVRNQEMVNLGADRCLAYIHDESPGATDCARKAIAAGIATEITRGES